MKISSFHGADIDNGLQGRVVTNTSRGLANRADGRAVRSTGEGGFIVDGWIDPRYKDVDGNPVKRTPVAYPYSYDTFVFWKPKKPFVTPSKRFSKRRINSYDLFTMDPDKHDKICREIFGNVSQYWDRRDIVGIEAFLCKFFDYAEVCINLIQQGCIEENGHRFWLFDVSYRKKSPARISFKKHEEETSKLRAEIALLKIELATAGTSNGIRQLTIDSQKRQIAKIRTSVRYAHSNVRCGDLEAANKYLTETREILKD